MSRIKRYEKLKQWKSTERLPWIEEAFSVKVVRKDLSEDMTFELIIEEMSHKKI